MVSGGIFTGRDGHGRPVNSYLTGGKIMKNLKKGLSLLLSLMLVLGAVSAGLMSVSADDEMQPVGDGIVWNNAEQRYEISSYAGLKVFADIVNGVSNPNNLAGPQSANAILTADITATDNDWTPIGNSSIYTGTFDGNGHTITGLTFNDSSVDYVGLFGYIQGVKDSGGAAIGGIVKNVGLEGGSIIGRSCAGGVVGCNKGTVINCYNTGAVSGSGYVGGVAGLSYGTVTNCYNTGDVSGSGTYVGGVAGFIANNAEVTNCYNTGAVSGQRYVGGVVGFNSNQGKATNCYYDKDRCTGVSAIGDGSGTNVKGLTTAQMTGEASNEDNTMEALFDAKDDNGVNVWLDPKADSEDGGVNYWFYPHLKGFAYDTDPTAENWPAKLVIYTVWNDDGPFTYNGAQHNPEPTGVVVSTLDRIPDELAECEVRYYGYQNGGWEQIDPPAHPGNYRVGYWHGDEEVLYSYFSIFETGDYSVEYQYRGPDNENWTDCEDCVEAGEYRAVLTFEKYGDKTVVKGFVITAAVTDEMVSTDKSSAEYNAQSQSPEVTVKDGETTLNNNRDYTVSYKNADGVTVSEMKNAGTYKVVITGKGNYSGSVEKPFSINPKAVTITANSAQKAYDGSALTQSGFAVSGLEEGDTHEFTVVMTADSTVTNAESKPNVIATVDGTDVTAGTATPVGNYSVTTANGTLTVTKAKPTMTVNTADVDFGQTATVTAALPLDAEGTVTFRLDTAESGKKVNVENGKATCAFDGLDIKEHSVEAVYSGDGNYEGKTETVTFNVNPVNCPLTINYEYESGGEAHEPYTGEVEIFNNYSVTSPEITGYTPDPAKVEGTMESLDGVEVTVTYTVNTYKLTWVIDGENYKNETIPFGGNITAPEVDEKEGYTFEWVDEIPTTMPAEDVTINGKFTAIEYTATFVADGETVDTRTFTVETEKLDEPAVPEKEGFTGEWSEYTLAASDITIEAVYTEAVPENLCPLDKEDHGDGFFGRVITFIHKLIWKAFRIFGLDIFFKVD